MKFSICIPNYNYARYIGETISSALSQSESDLEVVVADNHSTDNSVDILSEIEDERFRFSINKTNVGFSGNLGKVASMAEGDYRLMLSSDDLLDPDFLKSISKLQSLEVEPEKGIYSSTERVIDSDGKEKFVRRIDPKFWYSSDIDKDLSDQCGFNVYKVDAKEMLRRCLTLLRTPFTFASTLYHKNVYEAVEGYSQTAIFNPDKKFAWALLSQANYAYLIDSPLVSYRVHDAAQAAQQRKSGALKHITDEYIATFELPDDVLSSVNMTREDLQRAFLTQDIVLRGLALIADGDRFNAKRYLRFGMATFPQLFSSIKYSMHFRILLGLGPIGTLLAKVGKRKLQKNWEDSVSQ